MNTILKKKKKKGFAFFPFYPLPPLLFVMLNVMKQNSLLQI